MILEASISSFEVGEKVVLKALAVTDKYISTKIIGSIAKYGVNQPLVYRHIHPASPGEGEILGTVIKTAEVDVDGRKGVEITAEMMQYTPYQQKAVKYVKEKQDNKDPIKISIGLQSYGIDGKEPVDARPFEFSLTRIPVCDECSTHEVITMENDKKDKDAIIAELEKALDDAVKKNKDLTSKMSTFEDAGKKLEQGIADTATVIRKEYDDKLKAMQTTLETVTKELDLAKRQPIVDQIFKLEKDQYMLKFYQNETLENLKARLEEVKKKSPPNIITQTMEESRAVATDKTLEDKLRAEVRDRIKEDPILSKILFGKGLTDAERGVGW